MKDVRFPLELKVVGELDVAAFYGFGLGWEGLEQVDRGRGLGWEVDGDEMCKECGEG